MLAPAYFVKKAVLLGCAAGAASSALFVATLDVRIVSPVGSQRESDLLPGVVHARVTVTPDHGMPVSATSDENGHVRLEVPPGRARLRVEAPQQPVVDDPIEIPVEGWTLALAPPGRHVGTKLTIRVLDEDGTIPTFNGLVCADPRTNQKLSAAVADNPTTVELPDGPSPVCRATSSMDASQDFTLPDQCLTPGEWRFITVKRHPRASVFEALVTGGDSSTPVGEALVALCQGDRPRFSGVTGADGRVEIPCVAGEYVLRAAKTNHVSFQNNKTSVRGGRETFFNGKSNEHGSVNSFIPLVPWRAFYPDGFVPPVDHPPCFAPVAFEMEGNIKAGKSTRMRVILENKENWTIPSVTVSVWERDLLHLTLFREPRSTRLGDQRLDLPPGRTPTAWFRWKPSSTRIHLLADCIFGTVEDHPYRMAAIPARVGDFGNLRLEKEYQPAPTDRAWWLVGGGLFLIFVTTTFLLARKRKDSAAHF